MSSFHKLCIHWGFLPLLKTQHDQEMGLLDPSTPHWSCLLPICKRFCFPETSCYLFSLATSLFGNLFIYSYSKCVLIPFIWQTLFLGAESTALSKTDSLPLGEEESHKTIFQQILWWQLYKEEKNRQKTQGLIEEMQFTLGGQESWAHNYCIKPS